MCIAIYNTCMHIQLNMYIDEQSINPRIPASYFPIAVNNETLEEVINNVTETLIQVSRKDILISCPIIATVLTIIVIVTMLIIYAYGANLRNQLGNGDLSSRAKATTMSISIISFGRITIFILLDTGAILFRNKHLDTQVEAIYHSGKFGELNDIMYNIPVTLLVFDITALVACGIIVFFAFCFKLCPRLIGRHRIKGLHYYCLALTVVPLIFSCLSHAPYIIMAYVSDASYASSIFIYYVLVLFVEFGVLEYTLSTTCFDKPGGHNITNFFGMKSNRACKIYIYRICTGMLLLLLPILINGIMTTIFIFFYFVPIKYALSNAPNDLVVIYQSAIVLVGGYITYKTVFQRKGNEQDKLACDYHLKKNEIARLEDEIADLKSDVEANKPPRCDITTKKNRITFLRNGIALTSVKQRITHLQHEADSQINRSELAHLHNEVTHLSKDMIDYMEGEKNALASEDKTIFFRDEIDYLDSVDSELIARHQGRIYDGINCEPRNPIKIVSLRREMTASIKRKFAEDPDSLVEDTHLTKKDIDTMDDEIKKYLKREPKYEDEKVIDDLQDGESVAERSGKIKRKMRSGEVDEIDSLRAEIITLKKRRIEYRQKKLEREHGVSIPLRKEIDDLKAEIIILIEERITHLKSRQEDCAPLEREAKNLRDTLIQTEGIT